MPTWPTWWEWELDLSPHIQKRMIDRDFTEIELRRMLSAARGYQPDIVPDRWMVLTSHRGGPWHVIVQPDAERQLLVVVTAYAVEP